MLLSRRPSTLQPSLVGTDFGAARGVPLGKAFLRYPAMIGRRVDYRADRPDRMKAGSLV
jgi:hypothetical protein